MYVCVVHNGLSSVGDRREGGKEYWGLCAWIAIAISVAKYWVTLVVVSRGRCQGVLG